MIIENVYLIIWIVLAVGIYYSYIEHGKKQYANGMSDAISLHKDGLLKYKVTKNHKGKDDIEIKIRGDK